MQSDFGPRIRPEEITPETRRRLVRESYSRELFGVLCVFVPTVLVSLMVSLGYRWHGEPQYAEWQAINPILFVAVAILIAIHVKFHKDRRFLAHAPATDAVVKEMETSYNLTHTHRLIIKYKPVPEDSKANFDTAQLVTVALESDLKGFNTDLHQGDSISVLYDPKRPDHVRVIEEEHQKA
jgi:hypothetical protein